MIWILLTLQGGTSGRSLPHMATGGKRYLLRPVLRRRSISAPALCPPSYDDLAAPSKISRAGALFTGQISRWACHWLTVTIRADWERIWIDDQGDGFKVPHKQPKRGRLSDRWIVHSAAVGALQSRLVLRLRRGPHPRWTQVSDAQRSRRIHPRMSGDPCRTPTSSAAAPGRTATSRASTPAFAMSCSTARFSTLYARPRSSSRVGDATTSAHRNTHLSMPLKRTGFADRDAIPRGALGSGVRVR